MSNIAEELINDEFVSAMEKKGIKDRIDLVFYFPKKYRDYRELDKSLDDVVESRGEGSDVYVRVKLLQNPGFKQGGGKRPGMMKVRVDDGRRQYFITKFGGIHAWRRFKAGNMVHIAGKVHYDDFGQCYTVKNPEIITPDIQGKIAPVYTACGKEYGSEKIAPLISIAVELFIQDAEKRICLAIGNTSQGIAAQVSDNFKSVAQILKAVHFPVSVKHLELAKKAIRLINALYVVVKVRESHHRAPNERSAIVYSVDDIKNQLKHVPFQLTDEQKRSIWSQTQQLASREPMDHLIYGDVGCGKTVSYLIPAILAQLQGKQVVVLTPNSLLAKQIHKDCQAYGPQCPSNLIIQGIKRKELNEIDLSKKPILIGTSALFKFIENSDEFDGADLLICDEQQKLGTSQKDKLTKEHTNIVEATATPVPRTVAHSIYGDKAVSFIEEPPVKKDIESVIIPPSQKREAFEKMKEIIASGDQVAIICPNRIQMYTWFDASLTSDDDEEDLLANLKKAGLSKVTVTQHRGKNFNIRCRMRNTDLFETKEDADQNIDGVKVTKWEEVAGAENALESKRNVEAVGQLWEKQYPGQVVTIHGGMKTEEKIDCMAKALDPECRIIVTSSLIEVGLTFPRLRALFIQASDLMGISTLHQLRGRLARHGGKGLFMMGLLKELDEVSERTVERLTVMTQETRGSKLAEADMYHRGMGDLTAKGVIQSGNVLALFPGMKILPSDLSDFLVRMQDIKRQEQKEDIQKVNNMAMA